MHRDILMLFNAATWESLGIFLEPASSCLKFLTGQTLVCTHDMSANSAAVPACRMLLGCFCDN